jgi:hypothetical protein
MFGLPYFYHNGDLSTHEIAWLNGVERASTGGKKRLASMSSFSRQYNVTRQPPVLSARKTTAS